MAKDRKNVSKLLRRGSKCLVSFGNHLFQRGLNTAISKGGKVFFKDEQLLKSRVQALIALLKIVKCV